ncbi:MAG TPA: formate dehydrogenase accessory protein FdhE [Acidobacteriota bacterium]|nr:formate dehydrogenase accessory protein FdhE [Acidobacteriota bacterium]
MFCSRIAELQAHVSPTEPLASRRDLIDLVAQIAPAPLRAAAEELDDATCRAAMSDYRSGADTESPRSFFARVLLAPEVASDAVSEPGTAAAHGAPDTCPRCDHAAQVGCLRTSGDGTSLSLVCSLCLAEWAYVRDRCPACRSSDDRQLEWYRSEDLPWLQVRACIECQRYLNVVSHAIEPLAVADIDEIAALPLDVWAREHGYTKLRPNLVGI